MINKFREVLGNYPTGVTVVTAIDEHNQPMGLTVNSFASVSIDPLLILWSIDKRVTSYPSFIKTGQFIVHVLAEDQGDLALLFATKGTDRFGDSDWTYSSNQLPQLSGVTGRLHCKTYKTIDAGDHMIMIGQVVAIDSNGKEPLLYHKRHFGKIPESFYQG